MSVSTRIAGLGVHLPERVRSTAETEQRLRAENPGMRLATGLISRMTGVQQVHVAPDDWQGLRNAFPDYEHKSLVDAGLVIANSVRVRDNYCGFSQCSDFIPRRKNRRCF